MLESDDVFQMNEKPDGLHFAIIVEGHPRSYRDRREVALEAA
jgi:hypothetical protein